MITKALPHNLLAALTELSHVAMVGGAIALFMLGKIDTATFTAIMAGFGGLWSGVAGVLISTRQSAPSTAPGGGTPAPGAQAAPSTTSATPAG